MRLRVETPAAAPFERSIDTGALVIGRSPSVDLPVEDDSISRRHARVFSQDEAWVVEDLGSRNGTYVNGRAVTGAVPLTRGDVIRLGGTTIRVESLGGPPVGRPSGPSGLEALATYFRPASELAALAVADPGTTGGLDPARQAERLRLLNEVHRALATPISLPQLLDLILDRAFGALQPEEGVVLLRRPDGQFERAAVRRSAGGGSDPPVSRRLIEEVADKGAGALVVDAALDERFAGAQSILSAGVRSVIAAPLSDAEGNLGLVALYSRLHVRRFSEADLELLCSLASAAALRVRNVALAEQVAATRVLERELALAHDIQMDMLPRRVPERREIELGATLRPARQVGGDLYDFLEHGDHFWFIVGDVSGKGVGAALFMAVAKTLFRAIAGAGLTAGEVLARMNRELVRDNDRMMFVTAFVGCLDLASGRLEAASAGHHPPYWLGAGGLVRALTLPVAPALGVVEGLDFASSRHDLRAGDGLLLYTDGVTDARDRAGQAFGLAAFERSVRGHATAPAQSVVDGVLGTLDAFVGGAPPEDDITLLALRYRGV